MRQKQKQTDKLVQVKKPRITMDEGNPDQMEAIMEAKIDSLVDELVADILSREAPAAVNLTVEEEEAAPPALPSPPRSPSSAAVSREQWQSESSGAFVEHDLPLKGNEVVQGWTIPISLDRADMDARQWKSEHQDKFEEAVSTPAPRLIAGNKSCTDVKAPSFFAWTLNDDSKTPNIHQDRDLAIPGLKSSSHPPFGVSMATGESDWQSEYSSANVSAQTAGATLVTAGVASEARVVPPAFFFWPVSDQRPKKRSPVPLIVGTEHAEKFSWPIDETSPTLVPQPTKAVPLKQSHDAPFGLWSQAEFAPTKWATEYGERFQPLAAAIDVEDFGMLPPQPPSATAAAPVPQESVIVPSIKTSKKSIKVLTETSESFCWPFPPAAPVAALSSSGARSRLRPYSATTNGNVNMTTVVRDSYKWPHEHVVVPPVKKSSNSSDPNFLSHPVKPTSSVNALQSGMEALLEDVALLSIDSLAVTAHATAAATISSSSSIAPAAGDSASVPASSVTGPTTNHKKTLPLSRSRPRNNLMVKSSRDAVGKLAIVGTKIALPPPSPAATTLSDVPASKAAASKPKARLNTASKIFNKIKARSPANPVLNNKRYPSTSDRQNGRWVTETRSAFAHRPALYNSKSRPASK